MRKSYAFPRLCFFFASLSFPSLPSLFSPLSLFFFLSPTKRQKTPRPKTTTSPFSRREKKRSGEETKPTWRGGRLFFFFSSSSLFSVAVVVVVEKKQEREKESSSLRFSFDSARALRLERVSRRGGVREATVSFGWRRRESFRTAERNKNKAKTAKKGGKKTFSLSQNLVLDEKRKRSSPTAQHPPLPFLLLPKVRFEKGSSIFWVSSPRSGRKEERSEFGKRENGRRRIGMESKTETFQTLNCQCGSRAFFGEPFGRPFPASTPPFFSHERGVSRSYRSFCTLRSGSEEKACGHRRPERAEWSIFQAPSGAAFPFLPPALPLAHLPIFPLFSHTRTMI